MLGFESVKDLLQILVVPIVIVVLGALLPRVLELQRRRAFIRLIRKEVSEIGPSPAEPSPGGQWSEHLKKRFLHEEIFSEVSRNRDFILSLPPALAYSMAQMWMHFDKGEAAETDPDVQEHGSWWADYLRSTCRFLDGREAGALYESVCRPWEKLIVAYAAESSG